MENEKFELLLKKAKAYGSIDHDNEHFYVGYLIGLARQQFGDGLEDEDINHQKVMAIQPDEPIKNKRLYGLGYRHGLAGKNLNFPNAVFSGDPIECHE